MRSLPHRTDRRRRDPDTFLNSVPRSVEVAALRHCRRTSARQESLPAGSRPRDPPSAGAHSVLRSPRRSSVRGSSTACRCRRRPEASACRRCGAARAGSATESSPAPSPCASTSRSRCGFCLHSLPSSWSCSSNAARASGCIGTSRSLRNLPMTCTVPRSQSMSRSGSMPRISSRRHPVPSANRTKHRAQTSRRGRCARGAAVRGCASAR